MPTLYLWRLQALERSREAVAGGEPELQPAIERLRGEVEKALRFEPVSVVTKDMVPPSGDKHDYVSQGPYWWPNPDTPDGLPYVRRDGEVNPEVESLDSRKLSGMADAVETLALGGYILGNDTASEHAVRLLNTWFLDEATRMNPHLEFGQRIPGICEGRATGIIDTRCLCGLVEAIGLLEISGALPDQARLDLLMWMKAYRDWLVGSEIGREEATKLNNHATWYDAQLCAIAHLTGDPRIVHKVAEEAKEHRIATQIEPDGSQPLELARTRSFSYTVMNTVAFMNIAQYGTFTDVDLWRYETPDGRSLRKAIDFMFPYASPGERWTWQQITDVDRGDLVQLFRRAAVALDDPAYLDPIAFLPPSASAHRVHLCF